MTVETARQDAPPGARIAASLLVRSPLHALAIAAGIGWGVAFVVLGPMFRLQEYGDGSIFSFAVAVQDAWAIHYHNIPDRLFVYLYCFFPAERLVALTGDARAGLALYSILFFSAPLLGLIATFAWDTSRGRVFFVTACASTACFCPLVFGFTTEMWIAQALFWPTLAICHCAHGRAGTAGVFVSMLALTLTHEGAVLLDGAILGTLALRGLRSTAFVRAAVAFILALAAWLAIKVAFPPDAYIAGVMATAAWHFFDPARLDNYLVVLLASALAGYGIALFVLRRRIREHAYLYAALIAGAALAIYWVRFDHFLHSYFRYFMRTELLVATLGAGIIAAICALARDREAIYLTGSVARLAAWVTRRNVMRAAFGAALVVTLIHVVETAKFINAWTQYVAAVRTLATGTTSDPQLGDPRFVSSTRIDASSNRLAWNSTTPYLSILVAPDFAPQRLVVDPGESYFWLPCTTATAIETYSASAIPSQSLTLVRVQECEHRH